MATRPCRRRPPLRAAGSVFLREGAGALAAGTTLAELSPDATGDGASPTVLVVGAGNTAMDVARTARHLGAGAVCIDWMDRRYAPVRADKLANAAAEGVEIRFCTTIDRLAESEARPGGHGTVHPTGGRHGSPVS